MTFSVSLFEFIVVAVLGVLWFRKWRSLLVPALSAIPRAVTKEQQKKIACITQVSFLSEPGQGQATPPSRGCWGCISVFSGPYKWSNNAPSEDFTSTWAPENLFYPREF